MGETITFAGRVWPATGRGIKVLDIRPSNYVGLTEEVPGVEEYRWFLWRSDQDSVRFSDLDNAHAFITGHGIKLDFIEPFES